MVQYGKITAPKKIKFFLWELSHKAINTQDKLQHQMSYMYLSPQWCVIYRKSKESQDNLFINAIMLHPFGTKYYLPSIGIQFFQMKHPPYYMLLCWDILQKGEEPTMDAFYYSLLLGYMEQKEKKTIGHSKTRSSLSIVFFKTIVYLVIPWCKCFPSFIIIAIFTIF